MHWLSRMFSRRGLVATLLVIAGMTFSPAWASGSWTAWSSGEPSLSRVSAQVDQPQLLLNNSVPASDLAGMEYRKVKASGVYDFSQQVARCATRPPTTGGVSI